MGSLRLRLERRARPGNDDHVRWSADDFRCAGVDTASLAHEITSEDLAQMQRSKDAIDSTHARIAATQSEARMVLGLEESAANARRERSAVKMEMQVPRASLWRASARTSSHHQDSASAAVCSTFSSSSRRCSNTASTGVPMRTSFAHVRH